MRCYCCSCKADSWVRFFHFFLTLTIFYVQLSNGRSDLHKAWVSQACCYLYLFLVLLFVSSLFYLIASLINPGYLPKNLNSDHEKLLPDHQTQKGDSVTGEVAKETAAAAGSRYCRVCCTIQPMRTKHCYLCGRCVQRFDHHCPWLGNCVGERNHRYFWLFLLVESVMLVWSVKIGWSSLQWHLQLEDWIKTNVVDLLCFIIITLATLAVTMLLCYHTYLMLTGQTTWEQASRQRILYLKNLEMFTNPFDEGCYDNVSTFLCGCQQIGRNWETVYNKRVYR